MWYPQSSSRRTDAKCHGLFRRKIADGLISLSCVKRNKRRNSFRNVRKGGFMLRSKLRQNGSAIPTLLLARGWQVQGFFGLADPAPQRNIIIEAKAAFMRKPGIGQ